ncbi:hypothetical protein K402DRAFT_424624 [Aulographum hederae CBS 113979]|uniref:C3H1-type domain-containing protein n=1 Tax=Aulographum hederae CBS 113979 TaxID=1176131 RepID=A0A6G1GNF0_9PEZI|nr:hypothetical protein K402DRAFT_424624 [Aulographum hederae CBS 113979]
MAVPPASSSAGDSPSSNKRKHSDEDDIGGDPVKNRRTRTAPRNATPVSVLQNVDLFMVLAHVPHSTDYFRKCVHDVVQQYPKITGHKLNEEDVEQIAAKLRSMKASPEAIIQARKILMRPIHLRAAADGFQSIIEVRQAVEMFLEVIAENPRSGLKDAAKKRLIASLRLCLPTEEDEESADEVFHDGQVDPGRKMSDATGGGDSMDWAHESAEEGEVPTGQDRVNGNSMTAPLMQTSGAGIPDSLDMLTEALNRGVNKLAQPSKTMATAKSLEPSHAGVGRQATKIEGDGPSTNGINITPNGEGRDAVVANAKSCDKTVSQRPKPSCLITLKPREKATLPTPATAGSSDAKSSTAPNHDPKDASLLTPRSSTQALAGYQPSLSGIAEKSARRSSQGQPASSNNDIQRRINDPANTISKGADVPSIKPNTLPPSFKSVARKSPNPTITSLSSRTQGTSIPTTNAIDPSRHRNDEPKKDAAAKPSKPVTELHKSAGDKTKHRPEVISIENASKGPVTHRSDDSYWTESPDHRSYDAYRPGQQEPEFEPKGVSAQRSFSYGKRNHSDLTCWFWFCRGFCDRPDYACRFAHELNSHVADLHPGYKLPLRIIYRETFADTREATLAARQSDAPVPDFEPKYAVTPIYTGRKK